MSTADHPTVDHATLLAQRAWVRALAARLVRDPHLAEDLSQDAFVAALESPPRDRRAVRGWFASVLRRRAINAHRDRTRRSAREDAAPPPRPVRAPDDVVADAEAHRRVVAAVLTLAEPYRSTVLLHYYEDESLPEIAQRLGVPYDTVRTRLRRALATLRGRLDHEHGGVAGWAVPLFGDAALRRSPSRPTTALLAAATAIGLAIVGFVWSAQRPAEVTSSGVSAATVGTDLADVVRTDAAAGGGASRDEEAGAAAGVRVARPRVGVAPTDDDVETPTQEVAAARPDDTPPRPPALPTRILHGRVVEQGGVAIAGARVSVAPWAPDTGSWVDCDASGRFEIVVPDCGPVDDNGTLRQIALRASARGFVTRRFGPWDLEDDATIVLPPRPTAPLVVRVLGGDGRPVANCEVYLRTEDTTLDDFLRPHTTDTDGQVRASGTYPGGARVTARATSPDGVPAIATATLDTDGAGEIVLRFPAQRTVRVEIVYDGDPDPVLDVEFSPEAPLASRVAWTGNASAVLTIPTSVRRIRAVALAGVGPWTDVAAADVVRLQVPTRAAVPVELDVTGVDVAYSRLAVVFRGPGVGLAQAKVLLERLRGEDGRTVVLLDPHAEYTAMIAGGGTMRMRPVAVSMGSPIHLGDDPESADVTVRVTAGGRPVADAAIRAVLTYVPPVTATTDAAGLAHLTLPTGLEHQVFAAAVGTAGGSTRVTPQIDGPVVEIELAAAAMRRFHVPDLGKGRATAMPFAPGGAPQMLSAVDDVLDVPTSDGQWTALLTEKGAWMLAPGSGSTATVDLAPVGDLVDVRIEGDDRWLLIAVTPRPPGVHVAASASAGATRVPPGRYVLASPGASATSVYDVLDVAGTDGRFTYRVPDLQDSAWTTATASDDARGMVFVTVTGADGVERELPIAVVGPGRTTVWRTAGPPLRFEPAR